MVGLTQAASDPKAFGEMGRQQRRRGYDGVFVSSVPALGSVLNWRLPAGERRGSG